jgi:putative SOS response-associated peptidase YedK
MPLMCGRYSLTTPVEGLRRLFDFPEQPNLPPRYNIAPTQQVAAVRRAPPPDAGAEAPGGAERHLVMLRWGLIPSWAKEASIGNRMINARAESLAEKPAFRAAFRKRRCLLVADGFYEWRKRPEGPKQPYRIAREDGGPFAFAGLWERWRNPEDGAWIESCTIVTTDANALLAPIHERMPVILPPADYGTWLDPGTAPEAAQRLLGPYAGADLVAYPISLRVNKVANDDPTVIAPLSNDGDAAGSQPRLI